MKFCVNNRVLAEAIKPAVIVSTVDCVKDFAYANLTTIKIEDDQIVLSSYGGTASVSVVIPGDTKDLKYKCETEGSVTVNSLDFQDSLTTTEPGNVEIKLTSNELKVTLLSDKTNKRSMGTFDVSVEIPKVGTKYSQSIDIRRDIFGMGLNDVFFASGTEEKLEQYMCMLMETSASKGKQSARFQAGTGGRFVIKTIEGKKVFTVDEDVSIIFPKNNLSIVKNILNSLTEEDLEIRCVEQNASKNIPEQIMMLCGGVTLSLFGTESFTSYPDLDKLIKEKYPNRIYSDSQGWDYAIGSVKMTRRGHEGNIHNTEVVFEEEKERFMVTPQTAHACTTPIHIVDVEECKATGKKIWFKCNSEYLKEAVARSKHHGKMQFNFESQEMLKSIPDDKPKLLRPVFVKYPEKSSEAKKVTENFCMIFTVSNK